MVPLFYVRSDVRQTSVCRLEFLIHASNSNADRDKLKFVGHRADFGDVKRGTISGSPSLFYSVELALTRLR